MKAKSRKRLLISSVAMLLVAMLALGTATFAWFTQQTNATADNLKATSVRASNLLLSKKTGAWANHVIYDLDNDAMKPAATVNGSDWVYTYADNGSGARGQDAAITSLTSQTIGDYVYIEELNVKNSGTIDYTDVYFTISGFSTSANDYACFALVSQPTSENNITDATKKTTASGTFGAAGADKTTTGVIYQVAADTLAGLASDGTVRMDNGQPAPFQTVTCTSNGFKINVPDLDAGQEAYYDLYVWFDGTDKDCKDSLSGQSIGDLKFTIHGTPDNH